MFRGILSKIMWAQFRRPTGPFGRLLGGRMARLNDRDARWTLSLLDIGPESRLLEIGFGPGVSTQYAAQLTFQGLVAGLDHSKDMVQLARRRNASAIQSGHVDLRQGDVAFIPYADNYCDRAFSIHSIYFWEKPVDALCELRRVLKPGGILALTIQPADGWNDIQRLDNDLRTLYRPSDLVAMLTSAAFHRVRVEGMHEPGGNPLDCILGFK